LYDKQAQIIFEIVTLISKYTDISKYTNLLFTIYQSLGFVTYFPMILAAPIVFTHRARN